MKLAKTLFLTAAMMAASVGTANAAAILGNGAPITNAALTGGTVVDFESGNGSYSNYVTPGVTISGASRINGTYAGDYNTFGKSMDNNQGSTSTLTFNFAQAVSAFAFNFGASDAVWTLTAFSGANALESLQINPTGGSNTKSYFGLTGTDITSAKLTHNGGDYVMLDNLTFKAGAVPEPASWAIMIIGFGAVGSAMRRRRTSQTAFA